MLISRCAWHTHYHGYPLLSGVASWRGWNVRFTDGICPRCLARFRQDHRRLFERRQAFEPQPSDASTVPHEAA